MKIVKHKNQNLEIVQKNRLKMYIYIVSDP